MTPLQCKVKLKLKLKLNQHWPEAHAKMRVAYAAGGDNQRALGQWMDRLGVGQLAPGAA